VSTDIKQDALDNLADALSEDILNTPDDELLREVEEDYGDPRALANKFDQILERAEKQVLGTAVGPPLMWNRGDLGARAVLRHRPRLQEAALIAHDDELVRTAASPQVRSSVLDLLINLPDVTIRWAKGIFDFGSRISEFLSSLAPRTLAWSATAAAVAILVPAVVITSVVLKQQSSRNDLSFAARSTSVESPPLASLGRKADRLPTGTKGPDASLPEPQTALSVTQPSTEPQAPLKVEASDVQGALFRAARKLSDEEIAALVARGRALTGAGDIRAARLVLQQAAEAGNATAALELGATYDPIELKKLDGASSPVVPVGKAAKGPAIEPPGGVKGVVLSSRRDEEIAERKALPDSAMARTWYQRAKDLGSPEAAGRLERLSQQEDAAR
jgi:hypothetical protein